MSRRTLRELVDRSDPLWAITEGWLASAGHRAQVMPVERS
jgi:hypothetical protein